MDQLIKPDVEEILSRLKLQGWCILAGVISPADVADICGRVEEAVASQGSPENIRGLGSRKGLLAFEQSFAPYLADPRILAVTEALFGPHVRISFTTAHISYPGNERGPLHADWPFNQKNAGHIPAPYPDAIQHLSTLWFLSSFSAETGATIIVPGSHRTSNNPTGNIGVDPMASYPGEIRAAGEAGSVLLFDSRLWHAAAHNVSDRPRVGMAVRYAPWWLNLDVLKPGSAERIRMVNETGVGDNEVLPVPKSVYDRLPSNVQPLFRHWVDA